MLYCSGGGFRLAVICIDFRDRAHIPFPKLSLQPAGINLVTYLLTLKLWGSAQQQI
jgi:hypothetical protein